jgi:hypothetical protein
MCKWSINAPRRDKYPKFSTPQRVILKNISETLSIHVLWYIDPGVIWYVDPEVNFLPWYIDPPY